MGNRIKNRKSNPAKSLMAAAVLAIFFGSCSTDSVLSTDSIIKVRMFGSLEAPVGAEGTTSPVSQTYLFKGLALTKADGSGDVELYEEDPFTVRIVNRPQQIFKYSDLGDYVKDKVAFSKVTVKFDTQVVVATKETDEAILALDSGDFSLEESFIPEDSKEYTLNIKVSWGKTVTTLEDETEQFTSPGVVVSFNKITD